MAALQDFDEAGIIAFYLDPFWNLLAANNACLSMLPGPELGGNFADWLFGNPTAKHKVINWEPEARHIISLSRGAFGLYREAPEALSLLARLNRYPDFRRLSAIDPLDVHYGRGLNEFYTVRDSHGQTRSYSVQIADLSCCRGIQFVTAHRNSTGRSTHAETAEVDAPT